MRIIYQENENTVVVQPVDSFLDTLEGTLEEKMIHIANKDLPTGTKYELVEDSSIPTDDDFRDAWTYTANAAVEKTSADLTAEELASYNMTENL
jgi:hypothetical protein